MSDTFDWENIVELEKQYQQIRATFKSLFTTSGNRSKLIDDPSKLASCFNDLLNYQKAVGKVYTDVLTMEKLSHVLAGPEGGDIDVSDEQQTDPSQTRYQILGEEIKTVQQRFLQMAKDIVELKQQIEQKLPELVALYEDTRRKQSEIDSIKAMADGLKVYETISVEEARQELYEHQIQITELSKALTNKKDTAENNQLLVEDLEEEVEQLKLDAHHLRVKAISAKNDNMSRDKSLEEAYARYDELLNQAGKISGVKRVEIDANNQIQITFTEPKAAGIKLYITVNEDDIKDAHLVGTDFVIADTLIKRAKKYYKRNRNLSFLIIELMAQLRHKQ